MTNSEHNLTKEQQELLDAKRQELYKEVREHAAIVIKIFPLLLERYNTDQANNCKSDLLPKCHKVLEFTTEENFFIYYNALAEWEILSHYEYYDRDEFIDIYYEYDLEDLSYQCDCLYDQMTLHASFDILRNRYKIIDYCYSKLSDEQKTVMHKAQLKLSQLQFIKNMKTLGVIKND